MFLDTGSLKVVKIYSQEKQKHVAFLLQQFHVEWNNTIIIQSYTCTWCQCACIRKPKLTHWASWHLMSCGLVYYWLRCLVTCLSEAIAWPKRSPIVMFIFLFNEPVLRIFSVLPDNRYFTLQHTNRACHPGGHYWDYSPGMSCHNSFENQAPINSTGHTQSSNKLQRLDCMTVTS